MLLIILELMSWHLDIFHYHLLLFSLLMYSSIYWQSSEGQNSRLHFSPLLFRFLGKCKSIGWSIMEEITASFSNWRKLPVNIWPFSNLSISTQLVWPNKRMISSRILISFHAAVQSVHGSLFELCIDRFMAWSVVHGAWERGCIVQGGWRVGQQNK